MLLRIALVLLALAPARAWAQAAALEVPTGYAETPSAPAQAIPSTDVELATQNLDLWLEHYAAAATAPRITAGVLAIATGAAVAPVEGWLLSSVDLRSSANAPLVAVAGLGIVLAILDISVGIYQLARPSIPEQRLERWRAMRARGPISARELGRFEGELRGELVMAQEARWASLAVGIGTSVASVAGLAMTAALATDTWGQIAGYSASALFGVIGIVFSVFPWLDGTPEASWDRVDHGQPPLASIAPWVDAYGGGLSVNGTF
jgi:hypothetical protein